MTTDELNEKETARRDMRWFAFGLSIGIAIGVVMASPFVGFVCAALLGNVFMLLGRARSRMNDENRDAGR